MDEARQLYINDLRSLHQQEKDLPEAQRISRRQQLAARLKRLKPGASTVLKAVQGPDGDIHTMPEAMADCLRAHWANVFSRKDINPSDVGSWMRAAYPGGIGLENFPSPEDPRWRVRRRDVARAIKLSGNSSPGPDGIPYGAWRAMKDIGTDTLWAAMQDLCTDDAFHVLNTAYWDEADCNFNLGLLFCIPKQASGTTEGGEDFFRPEDTRPLSVVDCSNRILANAARLRWEAALAEWIAPEQRGFLPGRSMLANVIDMDEQSMRASLSEQDGALLLFDFAAAFPSVARDFLLGVLRYLRVPQSAVNLCEALYHRNTCYLQLGGSRLPGFELASGIRQGCPLSPLLFVTVMDSLLRRFRLENAGFFTRAFADDTATVVRDIDAALPIFEHLFEQLRLASGLRLNMHKCIIVPLGDRSADRLCQDLRARGSTWAAATFADHGKYLGFVLGPGREARSWLKPVKKAWDRVRIWPWSDIGLFFSTQVWNLFIHSVLSFIAQLESPPSHVLQAETAMLRKAAPGPGNWCRAQELHHLRRAYHFPGEYKTIHTTACAAQLRVLAYENWAHGGLSVHDRAAQLRKLHGQSIFLVRQVRWRHWYDSAYVWRLENNFKDLATRGISARSLQRQIAGAEQPWSPEVQAKIRKNFQRTAQRALEQLSNYDPEVWMRRKLDKLGFRDRRQMSRCLGRARDIAGGSPPRVTAALLGFIWNRWATARRWQCRQSVCLLGCGNGSDDRTHYPFCAVSREAAWRFLRIRYRYSSPLEHWALVAPTCHDVEMEDAWWSKIALLTYAVSRVTNSVRVSGVLPYETTLRALQQAIIEGTNYNVKE